MSISPPSDIILDVAKAADPTRYKIAADRLNALSATRAAASGEFAEALEEKASPPKPSAPPVRSPKVEKPAAVPVSLPIVAGTAHGAPADRGDPTRKAYRGFEATVLADFVQSMMPKDAQSVFGSGTAGEIWKSMLAEKIGEQIAQSGGIGIAAQLAAAHPVPAASTTNTDEKSAKSDAAGTGSLAAIAADALVTATERQFLATVRPDRGDETEDRA